MVGWKYNTSLNWSTSTLTLHLSKVLEKMYLVIFITDTISLHYISFTYLQMAHHGCEIKNLNSTHLTLSISLSSSGFVSGVAWESPHPDSIPQGWRFCLHHFFAGGHGAVTVPAAATWLGPCQPEPSLWASAHRLLHAYRRHALWACKLPLLPHGDPVWEAGRCCEVSSTSLDLCQWMEYCP